jgi:hypothetical protein
MDCCLLLLTFGCLVVVVVVVVVCGRADSTNDGNTARPRGARDASNLRRIEPSEARAIDQWDKGWIAKIKLTFGAFHWATSLISAVILLRLGSAFVMDHSFFWSGRFAPVEPRTKMYWTLRVLYLIL